MKKNLMLIIFLFCSLAFTSFTKEINLEKSARSGQPISVPYRSGDTYIIYTKPLHQTTILFGDEMVEYSETGDNISFTTISDKHSVRLKCIDEGLNTDLVVKTDKDTYYFKVISTTYQYNPMIIFLYPQKEELKLRNRRKTTEKLSLLNLDNLNNKYSVSKVYNWTPTQIFDDGEKTFLFMKNKIQELPALMLKTEDGKYSVVTYRLKETEEGLKIIVVDRIFQEAVLKLGDRKVIIKNKNFKY